MKFKKLPLLASIGFVFTALPTMAFPVLGSDLTNLTIFANTYLTTGANSSVLGDTLSGGVLTTGATSLVYGSVVSGGASNVGGGGAKVGGSMTSGDVATTGDGATIGGNITSSGAATIGANAKVGGNMTSGGIATTGATSTVAGSIKTGGYASIGANSVITGNVAGIGATTLGLGSSVGSQSTLSVSPIASASFTAGLNSTVASVASQVATAQTAFSALGSGNLLAATMGTNTLVASGGTIFSAASFSTTASTILTLDDQGARHDWVFNITDILATGASSTVQMANRNSGSTLTWNVGNGYASLGATGSFLGTIMAKNYVSVGAGTNVAALNGSCGLFSATSYVSTGDGASVGSSGCGASLPPVTPIPEPQTYAMLLTGLASMVLISRRRKAL